MKIAHFADLHFRPFDRHEEYRQVFQEFIDKSPSYDLDAIVIAGDILHEKTQRITPEVIEMLIWLFTELSKIAHLYIILGNHDGNLKNLHRRDAISPIVKALDNPNITLYVKSGVYPFSENTNFCVFSPFDEKGWEDVTPENGKINICLFHGSVQGCTTDMDYELDGEVERSFFDGYDFTFLGDIHKHQFMDDEKRIAYPGSTLQQNFGESIRNHGFLLWNIRSKDDFDVEHVELENKIPFVTLRWKEDVGQDKLQRLMFDARRHPDGSRFRVYSESKIPQHEKKKIENELKNRKKASLVVYKNDKISGNISDDETNKQLRRDLRDSSTILKLLKNFLGEDCFNNRQWGIVDKTIQTYAENLAIEEKNIVRGRTWIPRRIEFDNLMKFGEGNVIDFDDCNGIVGIFAPNFSGKSTAIAAIAYALFGRIDRELNQNHYYGMINDRREKCSAKFDFTVSGQNYRVHRVTEKVEKKDGRFGTKNKLWFYEMTDSWEEQRPLNKEKPQDTEKVIRQIVGTLEDFKLTALSNQRNVEAFMRERVTVRKQHLARFRDLQPLEILHSMANSNWAEQKTILKSMTPLDWGVEISKLEDEKNSLSKEIEDYESLLETLRENLSDVKGQIEKKGGSKIVTQEELDEQWSNVEKLRTQEEKTKIQIEAIIERKDELQNKLNIIADKKKKIDVDKIKKKLEKKNELEKEISGLKEKLKGAMHTLEQKERTVKKLKVVPCGDRFPTCKYIKDAHEEKGNIQPQKELVSSIELAIQKCEILIVDEDDYSKLLKEHSDLEKKEISIIKKISSVSTEAYKERLENIQIKLSSALETYKEMEIHLSDDDSVKSLQKRVEKIKSEIKNVDNKRIASATRIGKIDGEIESHKNEEIKYEQISDKCEIYQQLTFAFGKKGIPNQILRMDLPAINAEIREVLQDVDDIDSVEFELEEESDKLDIYVESNDTRIPIELCSGAQLVIASVALRVGLMRASNLPKPDMFILDEPFEGTDANRIDSVIKMINSLKKWFNKVFLISHIESIKETADVLIDVSKKGKDSYVYHV